MPSTAIHPFKSKLVRIIEENLTDCSVVPVPRKTFSESEGLAKIDAYAITEDTDSLRVAITGRYFCVASFAAMLNYVEDACETTFRLSTMRIRFQPTEGIMLIDCISVRNLELITSTKEPKGNKTLLGESRAYRQFFAD